MIYWIKKFVDSCSLIVVSLRVPTKLTTNNYKITTIFILHFSFFTCFAQEVGMGLDLDDASYATVPLKKTELKRSYTSMPQKVDLRIYAPPVQDQGQTNTCTGWALGYAACTIQEAAQKNISTTSTLEKIATSPDFVYINGKTADVKGCSAPMKTEEILKSILRQDIPIPRKQEFNNYCAGTSALTTASRNGVKIKSYEKLFNLFDPWQRKIDEIKKVLADNRPVIVGMRLFKSFKNVKDVWDGKDDGYMGSHALCIVGYDDNFLGGAFEIMNSWGTGWGDQGFAWVSYGTLQKTQSLHSAFSITLGSNTGEVDGGGEKVQNGDVRVEKTPSTFNSQVQSSNADKFVSSIYFKIVDDNSLMPTALKSASRGLIVVKNDSNAQTAPAPKTNSETIGSKSVESPNFLNFVSQKSYISGTNYRAYIEVSHPTYLYVLGSDLSGGFGVLFPADSKMSDFLSTKNSAIALPDENSSIRLDDNVGKDFMYFIYSYKQLDIANIVSELNSKTGSSHQKIVNKFRSALNKSTPLEKSENNMSFKSENTEDKFFIISLEIDHK